MTIELEGNISVVEEDNHFSPADYIIFSIFLIFSCMIGVYFGVVKKLKNVDDILMGNRDMGVFPTAMSLIASFMSAVTLLGVPAEFYQFGTMFGYTALSTVFVLFSTMYFYAPVFFRLKLTSVYKYLELRFNVVTRCMTSVIFIVQMVSGKFRKIPTHIQFLQILYMSMVVYAPALALNQVTGTDKYLTSSIVFLVCILYTALGGMKAVMWTDVLQVVIMVASVFLVYTKGVIDQGGFYNVWKSSVEGGRIEFGDFRLDPFVRHTVFSVLIGGYLNWLSIYGVNQSQVQRYLSVSSLRKVRKTLYINILGLAVLMVSCGFGGLVIYSTYQHCDPISTKRVSTSDQLVPLYVMDIFRDYPGLPGIFLAGIFSGSLSTVSTGINSLAAVTLDDFLIRFFWKNLSKERAGTLSKILTVIYGLISLGFVFLASWLGDVLQACVIIMSVCGGPILGVFTMGIFCPAVNSWGAPAGLLAGTAVGLWIAFGAFLNGPPKITKPMLNDKCPLNVTVVDAAFSAVPKLSDVWPVYRISYMWFSCIATVVTIIVGVAVSLVVRKRNHKLDRSLLFQQSDLHFPFQDVFSRKKRSCGKGSVADFTTHPSTVQLISQNCNYNTSVDNFVFEDKAKPLGK